MTVDEARSVIMPFGKFRWMTLGHVVDREFWYFKGLYKDREKLVNQQLQEAVCLLGRQPKIKARLRPKKKRRPQRLSAWDKYDLR